MANAKATMGKKRSATSQIKSKPAKVAKRAQIEQEEVQEESQNDGLFDNLDEEMDPTLMDDIMDQINQNDSQSEEEEEEEAMQDVEKDDDDEEEDDDDDDGDGDGDEEEEEAPTTTIATTTTSSEQQKSTAKRFRDAYMTKVTQAFGSDLDVIRQEPNLNGPRLNILIDSLEAGIDIFSNLEQEIILANEEEKEQ